jgi:hypothetical protein
MTITEAKIMHFYTVPFIKPIPQIPLTYFPKKFGIIV